MPNLYLKLLVILQLAFTTQTFCKNGSEKSILKKETCNEAVNKTHTFSLTNTSSSNTTEAFRASLFLLNSDNSVLIADGLYVQYNSDFSDSVDTKDAMKLTNINENFAIERDNILLAIERRKIISLNDTLFFNLTRTTQRNYQFKFAPEQFTHTGLVAFLQDSYLKTNTPIDLVATTKVNFNINADPASGNPNRFRVIFSSSVLAPLAFTSVNGYLQNSNINIDWKVKNQLNVRQFEIEKSFDGQQFFSTEGIMAIENASASHSYQWSDSKPNEGNNYYRIRSVDMSGKFQNSNVIKVFVEESRPQINIYPNPVVNETINLQLANQPAGIYDIRVFTNSGRLLYKKKIVHNEGSSAETIQIDKIHARGSYRLEIVTPSKSVASVNFLY